VDAVWKIGVVGDGGPAPFSRRVDRAMVQLVRSVMDDDSEVVATGDRLLVETEGDRRASRHVRTRVRRALQAPARTIDLWALQTIDQEAAEVSA